MAKLPRVTGEEAVRAFGRAGFSLDRIAGSHHILKRPGHPFLLSIPVHRGKAVGAGLLRSQIAAAGLTVEHFVSLV